MESMLLTRRVLRCVPSLLMMLAATPVLAQAGPVERLEPVVVTASRSAQVVTDTLPHTTVITRAEIEASQVGDVISLLRLQPGIQIALNGGPGSVASVFMRGTNSTHTLLLIDGLRVNAVGSGAADWRQLMLDEVERIEIVRGNVSALYGSEAIGGVVQVFTRSGRGVPHAALQVQAGGGRTRGLSLNTGGEVGEEGGKTRVALTVSGRSSSGFSAIDANRVPNANPDIDGFRNQSSSMRITRQIGEHEIGLSTLSTRARLDLDDATDYSFFGPPYNGRTQTHVEHSSLDATTAHARLQLGEKWQSTLQVGATLNKGETTSSYPASFLVDRTSSRSRQLSWQNSFALATGHQLTAGVEHLSQDGEATAFATPFSRRVRSVMAGYLGQMSVHELQLALRRDQYTDFGAATTGLAAYGLRLGSDWKAIVQASSAFRAPSFNDLYYPFFGNPALQPERARSAELGLQYAHADTFARAALFRNRISDLIVFDPLIGIANNIAAARITGLELSGKTRAAAWDLSANLTLQRPLDLQTGQRLLRRAAHTLNLGAAREWANWRWAADVQRVGSRADSDVLTFARIPLNPYSVVNLRTSHAINKNLSLGFALQNAFAARYQLVDGFNTPGRVFLVTLNART